MATFNDSFWLAVAAAAPIIGMAHAVNFGSYIRETSELMTRAGDAANALRRLSGPFNALAADDGWRERAIQPGDLFEQARAGVDLREIERQRGQIAAEQAWLEAQAALGYRLIHYGDRLLTLQRRRARILNVGAVEVLSWTSLTITMGMVANALTSLSRESDLTPQDTPIASLTLCMFTLIVPTIAGLFVRRDSTEAIQLRQEIEDDYLPSPQPGVVEIKPKISYPIL